MLRSPPARSARAGLKGIRRPRIVPLTRPRVLGKISRDLARSLTVQRIGSYNSLCGMLESGPAMASGSSSVVECDLAKVDVAGSTPVSRSKKSVTSDE